MDHGPQRKARKDRLSGPGEAKSGRAGHLRRETDGFGVLSLGRREWGWNINLDLMWTQQEHGYGENGHWNSARALLWSRKPHRLLASIFVHNDEYLVYTQGLYGITDKERAALDEHLSTLDLKKWKKHDGIQD